MDHRFAVVGRDLDGRVPSACGCSADEQRQLETLSLHLAGHMHHLVERGRDKAAETDQVDFLCLGTFEDLLGGNHHPHVDDLVVISGENDADDVLADVVNVTLDGCEQNLPLRLDLLASCDHCSLLGFYEGCQVGDCFLHYPGRLDHLGQKHLAGPEQVSDYAHTVHQRTFDHQQRTAQLRASFFGIDIDVRIDPFN